jgi:hypothetical protein
MSKKTTAPPCLVLVVEEKVLKLGYKGELGTGECEFG